MSLHRPDRRPADVVWFWFDKAFQGSAFPQLGMLGSDWGMGSPILSAEEYRGAAEARMTAIYGMRKSVAA